MFRPGKITLRWYSGESESHFALFWVIQEFCICAIHRLKQSAIALKVLISRAEESQSLEYACAILIRSVLSDGLHILNAIIICKGENNEESRKNLEDFCFSSLTDSINHLIQNVRKSTNAENKEQIYKGVRDYYLRFLEPHRNTKGEPKVQERAYNVSNSELAKKIDHKALSMAANHNRSNSSDRK